MIMKIIGVMLLALIVSACAPAVADDKSPSGAVAEISHRLYRYIDTEAGVACWAYLGPSSQSIDCLPIEETKLAK